MNPKISHKSRLELLDELPKHGIVAELGVFNGDFSLEILRRCHPKRLYLVDLYSGIVTSGDQNGDHMRSIDMERARWDIELRFRDLPITTVRADSANWLSEHAPGTLDFVYIDTTHTFPQTCEELLYAKTAVHEDGFICGHDYHPQFGAFDAVNQFCTSFGLPLEIFDSDKLPSYRIRNLRRENRHGFWKKVPEVFRS